MKKIVVNLLACLCIAGMMTGCGATAQEPTEKVTEKQTEQQEVKEPKKETVDNKEFLEVTPDVKEMFPDYKVNVTLGKSYIAVVDGCTRDDYDTYTAASDQIFVNLNYNSECGNGGCIYQAVTEEDAYQMDISYMADKNEMMIFVKRLDEVN